MSIRKYDLLVFVGRFQPFHLGHKKVVDRAFELADKVLILAGSANVSRSIRNPFTYEERKNMIYKCFVRNSSEDEDVLKQLIIRPLNDVMYNDLGWIKQVQEVVMNVCYERFINPTDKTIKIGLIGADKDHTSYYLKLFPNWGFEDVAYLSPEVPIEGTNIRNDYFDIASSVTGWTDRHVLSEDVKTVLRIFAATDTYEQLVKEHKFIQKYKKSITKYHRIEHTVDAVVIQSGHVLLIRRRSEPGKGKWALPGGFVNLTETLEEAMLRELREETKIKVPLAVLKGSIVTNRTYDNPNRSDRARIITQAYLIRLENSTELPKIKGSDDADRAKWVPISELDAKNLFEDHYFIINDFIGGIQ